VRRAHDAAADARDRRVLQAHGERRQQRQPRLRALGRQLTDRVPIDQHGEAEQQRRFDRHRQHVDRVRAAHATEFQQHAGSEGAAAEDADQQEEVAGDGEVAARGLDAELGDGPGQVRGDLAAQQHGQRIRVAGDQRQPDGEAGLLGEGLRGTVEHARPANVRAGALAGEVAHRRRPVAPAARAA
jgi:hypothetical protein